MRLPSDEYFAGFIDGEGYIGIVHSSVKGHYNGYVEFVQANGTDDRPLLLLQKRFGGSLTKPTFGRKYGNRKPFRRWGVASKQAETCVRCLLPYLIVKKDQAKNLLLMRRRKCVHYWKVPQREHAVRDKIHARSAQLNRRGRV